MVQNTIVLSGKLLKLLIGKIKIPTLCNNKYFWQIPYAIIHLIYNTLNEWTITIVHYHQREL